MIQPIIFSRDRACQLHLLLESWERFVRGTVPIVTYRATGPQHERAYQLLRDRMPWVGFQRRWDDFHEEVIRMALWADHVMMFADDSLWIHSTDLMASTSPLDDERVACVSLRLAPNCTWDFAHDQPQPSPVLERLNCGWLRWSWRGAMGDWGYPMGIDGSIFRTNDLMPFLRSHAFDNPNTLEAALAQHPLDRPLMVCPPEQLSINVPANHVQTVFPDNRTCGGPSPADLNAAYLAGQVIDIEPLLVAAKEANSTYLQAQYTLKEFRP